MQLPFQLKNHHHHHRGAMEPRMPPPPQAVAAGRVWRFRRMLVRVSAAERLGGDCRDERPPEAAEAAGSVGLDRMVLSFMEDAAAVERPPRGRCNCFNGSGHYHGSDDEEFDFLPSGSGYSAPAAPAPPATAGDALEALKGLVQSASVAERNLLADASRIAERCRKGGKKKADVRRAVADGLAALGYDTGLCKSRWDKSPSVPAGEHEYIDAVVEVPAGAAKTTTTRLIVEVDLRSEFEVARSTKAYRAALQTLPPLFVGAPDRLGQIVAVVAEAARQSMKKKGLHFPPWRKLEYMRAKWLSPHARCCSGEPPTAPVSASTFSNDFNLHLDSKRPHHHDADAVEQKKMTVVVQGTSSKKRPIIAGLC